MWSAERTNGTVKSYNGEKGYGFISCPGLGGDAMFLRTDLPEDMKEVRGKFLDKRPVTFSVTIEDTGKIKGTNVELVLTGAEDEQLAGVIKSYSAKNKYGFIASSQVQGGDVWFNGDEVMSLSPGVNPTGELVLFNKKVAADGKVRASRVMFQSRKIAERQGGGGFPGNAAMAGMASMAGMAGGKGPMGQPAAAAGGSPVAALMQQMLPMMQQILQQQTQGGGGGKGKRPGGPPAAAMANAMMGGMPPAKKMRTAAAPTPKPNVSSMGQQSSGWIKSYNQAKGYGFITAPGTGGQDVFFMLTDLPPLLREQHGNNISGRQVSFTWATTDDGRMRAQNIVG
eukprot:TRINITY_DN113116_c0_g1_i1.p1 TRINITY_DN113116_c0_g1~~TRINITY_DN113116_c0_g1_i1.p1  ORF type:complete len:340 (-),score=94.92 TRINITY_DN113116_c0_g1_i1:317-1336(-)